MTSDAEAKYKGAFWRFVSFVLMIALSILLVAFIIAIKIIIVGPPSLSQLEKEHLAALKSQGYDKVIQHGMCVCILFVG